MGVVWGIGLETMGETFFFIPTIVHDWKKCRCARWRLCFGNIALVIFRYCLPDEKDLMKMLGEKLNEEQT